MESEGRGINIEWGFLWHVNPSYYLTRSLSNPIHSSLPSLCFCLCLSIHLLIRSSEIIPSSLCMYIYFWLSFSLYSQVVLFPLSLSLHLSVCLSLCFYSFFFLNSILSSSLFSDSLSLYLFSCCIPFFLNSFLSPSLCFSISIFSSLCLIYILLHLSAFSFIFWYSLLSLSARRSNLHSILYSN